MKKRIMLLLIVTGILLVIVTVSTGSIKNEPQKSEIKTNEIIDDEVDEEVVKEEAIKEELAEQENSIEEVSIIQEEKEETKEVEEIVEEVKTEWQGTVLNARIGVVQGPSGKETYYNLDMSGVISIMRKQGYDYEYYIREDGVKMFGPYVMCAANLDLRPRGTILETSLGTAIVCDTGSFAKKDKTQVDIAVNW